jgi:hypothetical protein
MFGNNHTCTSKKEQWSVPSKKQCRLHSPDYLQDIKITKPFPGKVLNASNIKLKDTKQRGKAGHPLSENDIDTLAEITNGRCGLVVLMRKKTSDSSNITLVDKEVEIITTPSAEMPKTVEIVKDIVGPCTFEMFMDHLKISIQQQSLLAEKTKNQSASDLWFQHRRDRITASNFKSAVIKVGSNNCITNPLKSKTLINNVCGYYPKCQSKAISWGRSNEPIARNNYIKTIKKDHQDFKVSEAGLYVDLIWPFLGASPDGLVECKCHQPGLLEIKCPWTHRALSIVEFVEKKDNCLELFEQEIRLK